MSFKETLNLASFGTLGVKLLVKEYPASGISTFLITLSSSYFLAGCEVLRCVGYCFFEDRKELVWLMTPA